VIEFGVLGPLTVCRDSRPVVLNAAMLRGLLALLLHRSGQPLGVDSIVESLWPGQPPATARKTVQVYVGRLRRALGDAERIRHSAGGYTIIVAPDELDVTRFRGLIDAGRDVRRRGDLAAADRLLTEALGLWRGTPFADLDGTDVVAEETRLLEEQWLAAQELRAAVRLDLRRHHEVVADLAGLLTAHPYQERLASYLMVALYRSDRQSKALDLYRRVRDQLAEELGIEPGHTMSWLQQAILRGDGRLWQISVTELDGLNAAPTAAARPPHPLTPAATQAMPALLPPDVYGFTGRTEELASLDALLSKIGEQPTAVVISVVSGTAGVGKTALAVHWALRVRDRFPDGQLYVNLRGFDPTGTVVAPADAIRRFLDALAVPPQSIPADPAAQADLYRTLLADKTMLVLLDNARDPDQVRPLLPGAPGCLVLVTSRNRLTSLVAAEGAYPLPLDLLTPGEARDLLTRRLGPARVTAQPDEVDQLITHCARLPLALTIVAANAATHPHLRLAALADQLRHSRDRLDALSTSDTPSTDVRAVFSWSYQTLGADSARLFRLLGLHPGADISAPAVASLAALPADQVRLPLGHLAGAHLITEHTPGRYTFHDLLRAYAADLAHSIDPDEQRRAATGRILDHYLHSAYTSARLLYPAQGTLTLTPASPGTTPEHPADYEQAVGWFTAEHAVLLAAVDHAAATGFDTHTWQLAWTLRSFLDRQGHWHQWVAAQHAAVAAAGRLADPAVQAPAHRYLASAYTRLGRFDDAHTQLRRALDLTTRAGDLTGQAHIHQSFAHLRDRQGRYREALDHTQQALDLYRAVGHELGQARCLNAVGWYHTLLGDHQLALTTCQQALALLQELDDRPALAATWDSLGHAHHRLGHHDDAVTCYQYALDLVRELGDRYYEAVALTHLGDAHQASGDPRTADSAWQQALAILDQLDHPDAGEVRAKLHGAGRQPSRTG
jgi:DNA-binding SARP family transcriptional activator/tetratricopeptide (TPR) repeat protein